MLPRLTNTKFCRASARFTWTYLWIRTDPRTPAAGGHRSQKGTEKTGKAEGALHRAMRCPLLITRTASWFRETSWIGRHPKTPCTNLEGNANSLNTRRPPAPIWREMQFVKHISSVRASPEPHHWIIVKSFWHAVNVKCYEKQQNSNVAAKGAERMSKTNSRD